ncbi:unnamed protein product [Effrenium voratum]|uniref:Uncharacterized protein n=1 Tax=Effrenium voratum TaxID=2562239 RepID=A0AA36HXH1_9DINO|nr:unnamed protein product [Effrenium voratum]
MVGFTFHLTWWHGFGREAQRVILKASLEQTIETELEADSEPGPEKRARRRKVRVRRPPSAPSDALRPSRPSRVVSLSPAAVEVLVAAGDVAEHAVTEVTELEPEEVNDAAVSAEMAAEASERDRKFEDLDTELALYCEASVAARLAALPG